MKITFRRRLFVLTMLVAVLAMMPVRATDLGFADVPDGSWFDDPVSWAVSHDITNGTTATTFSPDATCTNAQVLTFLWRACGSPDAAMENPFTDISSGSYYYKAALWAYQNNMVLGSRFEPDKPCTRSMAVTYLWQFAGQAPVRYSDQFTDVLSNSSYAQAVAWAVDMEITNGTDSTRFSPDAICTRAQIMAFLYRGKILLNDLGDMDISEATNKIEEIPEFVSSSDSQIVHEILEGVLSESGTNQIEVIPSN